MPRFLLIEDNRINLELMSYLLVAFGHDVHQARSGDEGLAKLRETRVDVIACDIQLPGMDGYAIARTIKERPELAEIPVVAVTASAMVGDREQLLRAGFDGYISKPIDPNTFVADLEAFVRPSAAAPA